MQLKWMPKAFQYGKRNPLLKNGWDVAFWLGDARYAHFTNWMQSGSDNAVGHVKHPGGETQETAGIHICYELTDGQFFDPAPLKCGYDWLWNADEPWGQLEGEQPEDHLDIPTAAFGGHPSLMLYPEETEYRQVAFGKGRRMRYTIADITRYEVIYSQLINPKWALLVLLSGSYDEDDVAAQGRLIRKWT